VQGMINTALVIGLNILFLAVLHYGVTGYVLSIVLADVACALLLLVRERLWNYLTFRPGRIWKEMLVYSIPMIPTTVFWWITSVSDRYMVKGFISASANGIYAVSYKLPTILTLISGIFMEAWQFSAVTERDTESKSSHAAFFGTVFDSFQGMLYICAAGLIAFSKIFSKVLFADSYYDAWSYMPLLIMATVFSSLVTFMGSVYLVDKKSVHSFVTSMIGAVINVLFNLLLIPTALGATGAALATFISYFAVFIIRAVNTRKFIKFDLHTAKLWANTAIIGLQTLFIVCAFPGWIAVQVIGIAVIFALNAKPILKGAMRLLRR